MDTRMPAHPDPAAIRMVADRLEAAADAQDRVEIEMSEPDIMKHNSCETVCCHAGLYVLACMDEVARLWNDESFDNTAVVLVPDYLGSPWIRGAELMAHHLGFRLRSDLERWATLTPSLWGNRYGGEMFTKAAAFTGEPLSWTSVDQIVAHWRAVADRIEKVGREG